MIAVFLDAGPLSDAARKPGQSLQADALQAWVRNLTPSGVAVYVAEVTDYEVRRELFRAGKTSSVARLDAFVSLIDRYVPLTTEAMREAARLWAQARTGGVTTAPPEALDGDAILAAQVRIWARGQNVPLSEVIVATTNPTHLGRFVPADLWENMEKTLV